MSVRNFILYAKENPIGWYNLDLCMIFCAKMICKECTLQVNGKCSIKMGDGIRPHVTTEEYYNLKRTNPEYFI